MIKERIRHILLIFAITAVFAGIALKIPSLNDSIKTAGESPLFILDAGHGKPDGGTVGSDGTTEQELNLTITKILQEKLKEKGIVTVLTRTNENGVYSSGETIHSKKVSDINERIKTASNYPKLPIISVHMNSYPNPSVSGTQVFYKDDDELSKDIAFRLQQKFNEELQPDKSKAAKAIPKNVYLFSHIENPAVLIECGFLTNTNDLNRLKDPNHQEKIANLIACVLVDG